MLNCHTLHEAVPEAGLPLPAAVSLTPEVFFKVPVLVVDGLTLTPGLLPEASIFICGAIGVPAVMLQ